tara:strand:- start:751 stop:1149 length:399 start_codon:yes stop_codon:yes gene_type:complete
MSDKLECTCIEAYKSRNMRDPNCCACSCDHNDLVDQLAKANERVADLEQINAELIVKNNELKLDKDRLDLLDNCNAEFNKKCGSNYGWHVDWNHNRIALVDTGIPKTDVRTAIDKFKALLDMGKRRRDRDNG